IWTSTAGAPRSACAACLPTTSTATRWSATRTTTAASTATSTVAWAQTWPSTPTGASTATSSSTATSPSGSWVRASAGKRVPQDRHTAARLSPRSALLTPAERPGSLFLRARMRGGRRSDELARVLGLLLARQQPRKAFGRRDVAMQHGADIDRDRQLDAVRFGLAHHFVGGLQ